MDWQPISTAPRDGRVLLITNGRLFAAGVPFDYKEPAEIGYDGRPRGPNTLRPNPKAGQIQLLWSAIGCSAFSEDTPTEDYDGAFSILNPTHWMPLPAPPKDTA